MTESHESVNEVIMIDLPDSPEWSSPESNSDSDSDNLDKGESESKLKSKSSPLIKSKLDNKSLNSKIQVARKLF